MIIKAIHSYYIVDYKIVKTGNNEMVSPEGEIYEVIRISDGIPLFIKDHILRFFNSARLAGLTIRLKAGEIEKQINRLIIANGVTYGNIRFSFSEEFRAFFIPHKYPSENDYLTGVECGLLFTERKNPHAKTVIENVRGSADNILKEGKYYEVLLVNPENHVTEGSRSNVFFVKDNRFFTPSSSDVLPGTTRKRVISLIRESGWTLNEIKISTADLSLFEAAFITGTSPKVLPIRKIENHSFDTNHALLRELMKKYDGLVTEYLNRKTGG